MDPTTRPEDEGVVLITLVGMLMPLLLIAGAFTSAMSARSAEQRHVLDREHALLAAESGVDHAIFYGQLGKLTHKGNYRAWIVGGMQFYVEPLYLGADSLDNDGDGDTDESDEDVFEVTVTGTFKTTERKLVVYLGKAPANPAFSLLGAMAVYNPSVNLDFRGTPGIDGNDTNLDGSLAATTPAYGMTVASPGTIADLLSTLDAKEQSYVNGLGGSPSLGVAPWEDLTSVIAEVQNTANIVLTNGKYTKGDWGDGAAGRTNVIYRKGDLEIGGNLSGSGILVVDGNFTMKGTFRFDGVVVVLGDINNAAGTSKIYGGLIQGPSGSSITVKGTLDVYYSSEGLALATTQAGNYVAFNGWQEVAR